MLRFTVESSSGDKDYEVVAVREGSQVRMGCECDAASNGMHCKHRINLLVGTPKEQKLTSGNPADVETLRQWIVGTPLEVALSTVVAAERDLDALKARLSKAKKALGLALATGRVPA
ncbi:hypothetical protein ACVI1J_004071 [Bradyrhizobium diazoefficiens]